LPVYISLALNYFQIKELFSDNTKIIGVFKQSSCKGVLAQKSLKTTGLDGQQSTEKGKHRTNTSIRSALRPRKDSSWQ